MVDVPEGLDDATDVIVYGVESEQIEEENDAYKDMREELGEHGIHSLLLSSGSLFFSFITGLAKEVEDDFAELMPSCFLLNMFDCLFMNISSYCKKRSSGVDHV